MSKGGKIIYTETDEAPMLATYSLLPIIQCFTRAADIDVETRDISLAGRVIANFSDDLTEEQQIGDHLAELGQLAKTSEANIIKLPNISASIPQLKACIVELQSQGYDIPDYPEEPRSFEEEKIKALYDRIKGSAVNPVLREGNSDRRAPAAVKAYAKQHPHSMGDWKSGSKSHVAHMSEGDFFGTEKSVTVMGRGRVRIEHHANDGTITVLKQTTSLKPGEIIDSAVMSVSKLRAFIREQIKDAKEQDVLFSLHMKATMMKVSDPAIFGHVVSVFYEPVLEKYAKEFEDIGVDLNNGIGDLYNKIDALDASLQAEIKADIDVLYKDRPDLAMVNSDKGITNLHVPSDVIIDASMPAMIRTSGCMWNAEGEQQDTKAVIPDRCYAGVYQEVIEFCKENGAFDPTTMGSVPNVGLMAQKAEEYGSHDKTFIIPNDGIVKVINQSEVVLMEHGVQQGDIWRMCQVKDEPIRDWVRLAVHRSRSSNTPAVFWLDENRPHDQQLIAKVNTYLKDYDTEGLEIHILSPVDATRFTLERIVKGLDTISVTGNVLRDYLTDLFPILELGTSAKMLSIVPLMAGGGLFETGAGGSAPKHVQQFVQEGHLRWDSLGEFLALAASLEHFADVSGNERARILSKTLDDATSRFLISNKSPSRRVKELDNRGSHFYLAMYWATELAEQQEDQALALQFKTLAKSLLDAEEQIIRELNDAQGDPVEIGGYYHPDRALLTSAMRPSKTLNRLIS